MNMSRSHPEKGNIVSMSPISSPLRRIRTLHLQQGKGGLDDAKWFRLKDIIDLNFYDDMLPIVTEAVQKLLDHANLLPTIARAHA